ncbi:hypothetical protein VHEMI02059 [[Torrubiella] hemipterigena]|uniref:C2H2-type domain-containing protein n=1 Tax=[Torrubiella] hemipterigena TaxID=1531966 RepID=A0A0A1SNJ5_9HYPO|nr:hypothetical protein VHEMI02059 [[Torrubiella] hemipterigena]
MVKRTAHDVPPEASPPKKHHMAENHPQTYVDDFEDDNTTAQTPNSTNATAEPASPATVVTTPRPKFPSDLKTLACTWPGCSKTFNRPARLRDHLNSHTNSRPFKCPYDDCDKDYIEDKHLKQHIKAVHTHERKHVCQREGCGKSFVTGTRLKRHQAVHEGADRFRCGDCGQSFRKRETLNKHILKDHKGLPPHQCSEPGCTEAFESKGALRRHEQRAHGEIKYWCGECGLQTMPDGTEKRTGFTTEQLLQAHLKQEHQNCMFCDFKSSKQGELVQHIDMHHSGKTLDDRKTVLCLYENCTKRFTKKSNLTAHIRIAHEGVRFICGQTVITGSNLEEWHNGLGCGDKFSSKVRLEDHIRYVHLGQARPKLAYGSTSSPADQDVTLDNLLGIGGSEMAQDISCPNCNYLFKRYHDLNKHLESGVCPGMFATDTQLIQDFTTLHDAEPAPGLKEWPSDLGQDEIFAAEMDYGPAQDDWLQDEASIMLLARKSPDDNEDQVDPALSVI